MMKDFVKAECHQGIILFFFAILAIIITNSNFHNLYEQFLSYPFSLNLSFVHIYRYLDVKDWINEGLMAVFFLYVGLELKREIIVGELSSKAKILLPSLAAFAGVVCPALIYSYFNIHDPIHARGWAIPSATDIAFAIGVLSLFGNKIHNSLKIFLVALAVFDDLAAIVIIALFYSNQLNIHYINLIFLMIAILLILNRLKVTSLPIYLICGIVLWIFVLKSGIHSTIAGVLLSIFIPLSSKNKTEAPLQRLEEKLYPVVGYFILPLFAFANSGISFSGLSFDIFSNSIVIGIAAGLFIGKQFGVFTTLFYWTNSKSLHYSITPAN